MRIDSVSQYEEHGTTDMEKIGYMHVFFYIENVPLTEDVEKAMNQKFFMGVLDAAIRILQEKQKNGQPPVFIRTQLFSR